MAATVQFRGTDVCELIRLAERARAQHDPRKGLALKRALDGRQVAETRHSTVYALELEDAAIELVRDQAPWLAYRHPDVFGEGLNEFAVTDHGIAEQMRGRVVEDVVITRSGGEHPRIGSVTVKLEGGDALRFVLPFGFHVDRRPARPSELAMAATVGR